LYSCETPSTVVVSASSDSPSIATGADEGSGSYVTKEATTVVGSAICRLSCSTVALGGVQ
jgi:signal recognition particle receptor subunit beta